MLRLKMEDKASTKVSYRSPILCCSRVSKSILNPVIRTVFISAILALFLLALGLALGGVLSSTQSSSKSFYIASLFFVLVALLLLNGFLWMWKKCPGPHQSSEISSSGQQSGVATISSFDYYNHVPPDRKTDYPMGPYLVLTLPRSSCNSCKPERRAEEVEDKSIPSTPGSTQQKYPRRNKNLPPLASAETLSPSLQSSCGSIDSVV